MNATNDAERIFAVGDIHGCYDKLTALLARLPIDPARDTLVFLGDYLNRGPKSREVIDCLLELQARGGKTVFLMGNHEHLLLDYAATGEVDMLRQLRNMGVEATLASYGNAPVRNLLDLSFLPEAHLAFLSALALSYRAGSYLFVHADASFGAGDDRQLDQLLSSRRLTEACEPADGCVMIFGHTAFETPFVTPRRIGIDTGAASGNLLTAVELPALRFYHA